MTRGRDSDRTGGEEEASRGRELVGHSAACAGRSGKYLMANINKCEGCVSWRSLGESTRGGEKNESCGVVFVFCAQ